ncbi:MAG TPA: PEP-CTERM sorting domain-containing protein [Burkholderiaceae bacterium]|jgi:hypothetical protein
MKALHLALCLPLTWASLTHADVAVPIANGGFEDGFTSANAGDLAGQSVTPYSWSLLVPGGESRAGWSQGGTSPASPDGGGWWSLEYVTGWTSYNNGSARYNAGGIQQSLTGLTVGDIYSVSFYSMANAPAASSANGLGEYWSVSFGGITKNGATVYSNQPTTWTSSTLSFVATSSSQVLSFMGNWLNAIPGSTPTYLNLDGVKVTDISLSPVPEASTMNMILAGLGVVGVAGCLRRRRSN